MQGSVHSQEIAPRDKEIGQTIVQRQRNKERLFFEWKKLLVRNKIRWACGWDWICRIHFDSVSHFPSFFFMVITIQNDKKQDDTWSDDDDGERKSNESGLFDGDYYSKWLMKKKLEVMMVKEKVTRADETLFPFCRSHKLIIGAPTLSLTSRDSFVFLKRYTN